MMTVEGNIDLYLLHWYFVAEHHDLYERWKEDFLADPPDDYTGARMACAVESTAPPAGSGEEC